MQGKLKDNIDLCYNCGYIDVINVFINHVDNDKNIVKYVCPHCGHTRYLKNDEIIAYCETIYDVKELLDNGLIGISQLNPDWFTKDQWEYLNE